MRDVSMIVIGGSGPQTYAIRPTRRPWDCCGGKGQRPSGPRLRFAEDPIGMHLFPHGSERRHLPRERLGGIIMELIGRESFHGGDDRDTASRCCPTANCCPPGGNTGVSPSETRGRDDQKTAQEKREKSPETRGKESPKKEGESAECEPETLSLDMVLEHVFSHIFGNTPRPDVRCGGPSPCPTSGASCDRPSTRDDRQSASCDRHSASCDRPSVSCDRPGTRDDRPNAKCEVTTPKPGTSRLEEDKSSSKSGAARQEPQSKPRSDRGCQEPQPSSRPCAGRQDGHYEENGGDYTLRLTLDKLIDHVFSDIFGEPRQDRSTTTSTATNETCAGQQEPRTTDKPGELCPGQTAGSSVTPTTQGPCCKETTTQSSPVIENAQNQDQVHSDDNRDVSAIVDEATKSDREVRQERDLNADELQNEQDVVDHCHTDSDDEIKMSGKPDDCTDDIEHGESIGEIDLGTSTGDIDLGTSTADIELDEFESTGNMEPGESTADIVLGESTGESKDDIDPEEYLSSDTDATERPPEQSHGDELEHFSVTFDMSSYAPDDIRVKQTNDELFVDATREQIDGGVTSSTSVQKAITLPSTVDPDTLRCRMGDDGHVTITAEYRKQLNGYKFMIVEI